MTKKIFYLDIIVLLFILIFVPLSFAQQQLTITTYYPSPMGSFRNLRINRMAIDPARAMPAADGNLFWGASTRRGMLLPDQGSSIELGGSGTPYIDFSNDNSAANDFDARLILMNDNTFRIHAGQLETRRLDNSGFADIWLKCFRYESANINPTAPHTGSICEPSLVVIP